MMGRSPYTNTHQRWPAASGGRRGMFGFGAMSVFIGVAKELHWTTLQLVVEEVEVEGLWSMLPTMTYSTRRTTL
jgi:hypothetical protein